MKREGAKGKGASNKVWGGAKGKRLVRRNGEVHDIKERCKTDREGAKGKGSRRNDTG